MQHTGITFGIAILMISTAAACGGPELAVRHQDPDQGPAVVYVDDEAVGRISQGDELEVDVDRGMHTVSVMPAGSNVNPWAEDGHGWRIFVDKGTVITLFGSHGQRPSDQELVGETVPSETDGSNSSPYTATSTTDGATSAANRNGNSE